MKIKKTGYYISAIFYLANSILSFIFKLNTRNTWQTLLGVFIIITPAFIQIIFNIKANKEHDNIAVLYIVLGLLILMHITGIIILFLGVFGLIKLPLY